MASPLPKSTVSPSKATFLQPGVLEALKTGPISVAAGRGLGVIAVNASVIERLDERVLRLLAEHVEPIYGPAPHRSTETSSPTRRVRQHNINGSAANSGARVAPRSAFGLDEPADAHSATDGSSASARKLFADEAVAPVESSNMLSENGAVHGMQQEAVMPVTSTRATSGVVGRESAKEEEASDAASHIQAMFRGRSARTRVAQLRGSRQLGLAVGQAGSNSQSVVEVAGSFDGWRSRIVLRLLPVTARFQAFIPPSITLEPGQKYHYKFIVDGNWRTEESIPSETDEQGHTNHVFMP